MKSILVLIAEDEALEALLLSNCLKLEGYQVCEIASRGSEVIRIAAQEKPDIIVMDNGLADGMSGLDTAVQIRKFSTVPILFLSGYLTDEMQAAIERMSPSKYLGKPARVTEIITEITKLLKLSSTATE